MLAEKDKLLLSDDPNIKKKLRLLYTLRNWVVAQ